MIRYTHRHTKRPSQTWMLCHSVLNSSQRRWLTTLSMDPSFTIRRSYPGIEEPRPSTGKHKYRQTQEKNQEYYFHGAILIPRILSERTNIQGCNFSDFYRKSDLLLFTWFYFIYLFIFCLKKQQLSFAEGSKREPINNFWLILIDRSCSSFTLMLK